MNYLNRKWEKMFAHFTLIMLSTILFGYFLSSLAFGLWFSFTVIWIGRSKQFKVNFVAVPLFIFGLFSIISVIWSVDRPQTIHAIGRQLPLILFGLAGLFIPRVKEETINWILKRFTFFVCTLALVLIFLALIRYYTYQFKEFLYYHELVSPLDLNAIYVSFICSFCFLFLLQCSTLNKVLRSVQLFILGLFILLLSSKIILFLTATVSVVIIQSKFRKSIYHFISIAIFSLFLFLLIFFDNPIKQRFTTEFDTNFEEILIKPYFEKDRIYTGIETRLLQLRVFGEIMKSPKDYVFGLGLDGSKKLITKTHQRLNTPKRFHTYNFHNQYLQVMSELGIIGLTLLILILLYAFRRALFFKWFLPFVILSTILFFTESVLWRQRGILFFGKSEFTAP